MCPIWPSTSIECVIHVLCFKTLTHCEWTWKKRSQVCVFNVLIRMMFYSVKTNKNAFRNRMKSHLMNGWTIWPETIWRDLFIPCAVYFEHINQFGPAMWFGRFEFCIYIWCYQRNNTNDSKCLPSNASSTRKKTFFFWNSFWKWLTTQCTTVTFGQNVDCGENDAKVITTCGMTNGKIECLTQLHQIKWFGFAWNFEHSELKCTYFSKAAALNRRYNYC